MKKTLTITGIIFLALLIVIIGVYFFAFSDSVVPATLIVTSGVVDVDTGSGFKPVTGMMTLSSGDVVRTSLGARAAIVLYESSVTLLESETQVAVKSLSDVSPILFQEYGVTFTRFTSLTSAKMVDVQTNIGAFSTRGASFSVYADGARVYNGFITAKGSDGMEHIAQAGEAIVLDYGLWNKRVTSTTERAIMRENSLEAANALKTIRNNLVFTNKKLLGIAQKQYGVTPVMILDMLAQADFGKIDAQEISVRVPVKVPVMTRVVAMTQIIAQETQNYFAPVN